jgi:putative FmdB family regulatory protein
MPTYEYECKNCSHSFEVFQSISDPPLTICPECGSEIRRLIFGGAGVIFKGSGFYVTDKNKSSVTGTGSAKTDKKPATDAKPVTGESAPSTPAPAACGSCPNKGASPSCPA